MSAPSGDRPAWTERYDHWVSALCDLTGEPTIEEAVAAAEAALEAEERLEEVQERLRRLEAVVRLGLGVDVFDPADVTGWQSAARQVLHDLLPQPGGTGAEDD